MIQEYGQYVWAYPQYFVYYFIKFRKQTKN